MKILLIIILSIFCFIIGYNVRKYINNEPDTKIQTIIIDNKKEIKVVPIIEKKVESTNKKTDEEFGPTGHTGPIWPEINTK
ncbi:MAG: hypothetical protein AABY32_04215 [Nanoarchaeota archaeon]